MKLRDVYTLVTFVDGSRIDSLYKLRYLRGEPIIVGVAEKPCVIARDAQESSNG